MGYENIILEKRDHVATLTINHPPANAINLATLEDIERALDDVEQAGRSKGPRGLDTNRQVSQASDCCDKRFCTGRWLRTCIGVSF